MDKSRSFSIFLLKAGYDWQSALKDGHTLETDIQAKALPPGASLFLLNSPPTVPWWRAYFDIQKNLVQTSKGALVFLPVGDRVFAVAFGHAAHNLKEGTYEYDFGLRVTLNCVDPKRLKNTDSLEPGIARRQRTQVSVDSDLTYFDFDRDSKIPKSLTGKAKPEYRDLSRHATGATNLRINSPVAASKLPELCTKLLTLYGDNAYKTTFPGIQNITPVRDPTRIAELDAKALEAFNGKDADLYLAIPALIEYNDAVFTRFGGAGASLIYDDAYLESYYQYLALNNVEWTSLGLSDLKGHTLTLTNEVGDPRGQHYSIFSCFVFDTTLKATGDAYHLVEGNWYRVASSYVSKLADVLDPLCADLSLPAYEHDCEGDYNKAVAQGNAAYLCLDLTSIAPPGQTAVEPCDLYCVTDGSAVFCHVKVSTFSADLSHLFNQGTNAVELLKSDDQVLQRLRQRIAEGASAELRAGFEAPLAEMKFRVVFAMVTHKDAARKSKNLPLFSRVSLMRSMKALRLMGIPATYGFIPDKAPKSEGKKKKRKPKTAKPGAAGAIASPA